MRIKTMSAARALAIALVAIGAVACGGAAGDVPPTLVGASETTPTLPLATTSTTAPPTTVPITAQTVPATTAATTRSATAAPVTTAVTTRSTTAATAPPTTAAAVVTTRAKATANVSYANCTAVRQAGAAPIHRGEPGYGSHLDRDNDGIGCE